VITPYLVKNGPGDANLGSNVFFMWGGLCCISLAFAYFLVPEAKGLSLEQIDKMMEESTPRTSAKWVPHSTFASEMHLANKGIHISGIHAAETVENVQSDVAGEKTTV
jgi:hypothetical protein